MSARFTVEFWEHGWLVVGSPSGLPMTALGEVQRLFPKSAIIDAGIAHHFLASGDWRVALCIAIPAGSKAWRAEIAASLAKLPPEEAWFRGLDVGMSSLALFAVLCADTRFKVRAGDMAKGAIPHDADDFGRCLRLIERFPTWRGLLAEVAAAYPETKWPAVVARWDELAAAAPAVQSEILKEI